VESSQAQLDHQRFLLEGARLTLAANIVTTVIQECSLRERIEATSAMIAAEEEQLRLVRLRLELGAAVRSELLAQQAQVAQTRSTLPPLEKELALTRHRLALLAGLPPSRAA
jgi:outer membrane protein TolC